MLKKLVLLTLVLCTVNLAAEQIKTQELYYLDIDNSYQLSFNDKKEIVFFYPSGSVEKFRYYEENERLPYFYDKETKICFAQNNNVIILYPPGQQTMCFIPRKDLDSWIVLENEQGYISHRKCFSGYMVNHSNEMQNIVVRVTLLEHDVYFELFIKKENLLSSLAHAVINCSFSVKTSNDEIHHFPLTIFPGSTKFIFTGSTDALEKFKTLLLDGNLSILIKKHLDYYKFEVH